MFYFWHPICVGVLLVSVATSSDGAEPQVFMANGIKIGEVDQQSAIIWARLTQNPKRHAEGKPFTASTDLSQADLAEMEGSVVGAQGEIRVVYGPEEDDTQAHTTAWKPVDRRTDFTHQFVLEDLRPGTRYEFVVQGRPPGVEQACCAIEGSVATAPSPRESQRARFTVVTGQEYSRRDDKENGHLIYPVMQRLRPDFFVHTGDIEYYDKPLPEARDRATARFKWNRIYAMPFQREFHNRVASYFMKDDHDTLKDDCWPGQRFGDITWEQGLALFREQVPMGDKTYRTYRWGKDLQVWLVEGRDFRSSNNMPDGPGKTIWGDQQKEWFFDTVNESEATFRILISPTPLVGPDRKNKKDNHANTAFAHEGQELREFIGSQEDMFVVCGDRHWQYVSVDPETGVREYSCGPTSNRHAAGFTKDQRSSMHRFLRIKGGFLCVTVDRQEDVPEIKFCHYGVDGTVYHQDIFTAGKAQP